MSLNVRMSVCVGDEDLSLYYAPRSCEQTLQPAASECFHAAGRLVGWFKAPFLPSSLLSFLPSFGSLFHVRLQTRFNLSAAPHAHGMPRRPPEGGTSETLGEGEGRRPSRVNQFPFRESRERPKEGQKEGRKRGGPLLSFPSICLPPWAVRFLSRFYSAQDSLSFGENKININQLSFGI